jgi:hypothetical protein
VVRCVDGAAERIYQLTALGFQSEIRVPGTAKLSRKFFERRGDDIAVELVDWFNAVDTTYQTQLKETNELLWERFKATLDAGLAGVRGEIAAMRADLLKWMFIYWTGTVVTLGGLIVGMAVLLSR